MGFDVHRHRRNLNILVVGGSGAGKTRFFCKPNILNCNTSFVCLDPKGEQLRDTGALLESQNYTVKVLDLINMEKSHCYNPFRYLQSDNDVQRLVTNLFKATTPKGSVSKDPFWDTTAAMLLMALMFYLWYEAPEDEQNFAMVLETLRAADIPDSGDDDEDSSITPRSPLDELFDRLETKNPDHIALKYYRDYKSGSGKTLKSIQITLASRLEKLNLDSLRHPNVAATPDGKGERFIHGEILGSVGTVELVRGIDPTNLPKLEAPAGEYALYSEQDLEKTI